LAAGREPGRRLDVVLGILIGITLGIAIVAAFVFLGGEDTIDAPRVSSPSVDRAAGSAGGSLPLRERSAAP